nr:putative ribonuclease H-like domain-containing protein [Tanacetum cinerariifolium]
MYEPTSAEEKLDRMNEIKAGGTLLMALPNKDQLKFHSYQDTKLLMEAIKKRYRGNKESKKVQRTLLKQQYENFAGSTSETLDQMFDRLQKLIRSSSTSQNPQNVAFVSSNSTNSTSNTNEVDNTAYGGSTAHTQEDIKQIDPDDLEEMDLHWEMAMLTIKARRAPKNQENRGREYGRKTVPVENPTENALIAQDGNRGSDYEVDFCSKTCIKAYATLKEQYDSLFSYYKKSQFNLVSYKAGLQSVEERLAYYNKNKAVFEEKINILNYEVKLRDNALVKNQKKLEKAEKERDELKLTLEKFQNSYKSLNNLLESQVSDKFKNGIGYKAASLAVESFVNSSEMLENQENVESRSDKEYHAVPPPYTGNYIPPKPDLMFIDEQVKSEYVDVVFNVASSDLKTVESKHEYANVKNKGVYNTLETKHVRKNSFSPPIIEDWNSDDESEGNPQQKEYKEKEVNDSGCSKHMTGNKCYLTDYEDYDGGFVSFGDGNGRISGKGKIKTRTLDFDDVYFFKELKYNMFRITREFSVVRTPQQNGVAERKNKTLIEAARTIIIWANLMEKLMRDFLSGTKDNIVAGQAEKNKKLEQEYILIPICTTDPLISQGPKDSAVDAAKKATKVDESRVLNNGGQDDQATRSEFERLLQQERQTKHINNTNNINIVSSPVGTAGPSFTNTALPSPTNAAGTLASTNAFEEHPFERFSPFKNAFSLPHVPIATPINDTGIFGNAYDDEAVEEEVNMNNVVSSYTIPNAPFTKFLKDHPEDQVIGSIETPVQIRQMTKINKEHDKWVIGTKWVFRNKKDERGIVVKNKARLVAQGHTQEEGIDYDEVFAPVSKIEAIWLFLAYASFKDFVVYQMDVKIDFLYGKIEKEAPRARYETLSTYLMDNDFHRGQIDKTLFIKIHKNDILLVQVYVDDIIFGSTKKELRLQVQQKSDGIFISLDKYVDDILKKFDFSTMKTASTPMEPNKALIKDAEAQDVDVHSLMYLIASRPDITFAVCACARFQVTPKTSHIHVMKRIFRYLKGQPKLGLWYPRDSPFDLEAYSQSDYAGASLDMKSATGGCQFLGKRLISWQCKKQTIVANSTTEAEYVAVASCCGQVYTYYCQMKVNAAKHKLTTAGDGFCCWDGDGFKQTVDFLNVNPIKYALIVSPTIYTSCIKQFWTSAKVKTVNDDVQLQAIVDGKKVIVNEASIRRDLRLDDAEGTACIPNAVIFEELARIGVGTGFLGVITPLFETMIVQAPEEMGEIPPDTQDTPILSQPSSSQPQRKHKSRKKQRKEIKVPQTEPQAEEHIPTPSHDPLPSGEDRLQLNELMDICTKLSDKVLSLEQTKTNQAAEIEKLKKRVKKLEGKKKKRTHCLKWLYKRRIAEIDAAEDLFLIDETTQDQGRINDQDLFGVHDLDGDEVFVDVITSENVEQDATVAENVKETKKPLKKKDQIALDEEVARKLKAEMNAKLDEEERIAREKNEANRAVIKEWDDVQATIDVDRQLAEQIQAQEREHISIEERSKLLAEIIESRRKYIAAKRAEEIKNKPPTRAQQKSLIEDLEVLRSMVKDRFKKTKPMDDMDNLLFQTLKIMFEHHVEDIIWKYHQGAVKMYPFTNNVLHQLWKDVKLQVDYEVEMAYDLLRLIRRQINEGYKPECSVWIHPPDEDKDLIEKLEDSEYEHQV